jgi:uncharacterized protein involved in outer membrane biogenesis
MKIKIQVPAFEFEGEVSVQDSPIDGGRISVDIDVFKNNLKEVLDKHIYDIMLKQLNLKALDDVGRRIGGHTAAFPNSFWFKK